MCVTALSVSLSLRYSLLARTICHLAEWKIVSGSYVIGPSDNLELCTTAASKWHQAESLLAKQAEHQCKPLTDHRACCLNALQCTLHAETAYRCKLLEVGILLKVVGSIYMTMPTFASLAGGPICQKAVSYAGALD